MATEKAQRKVAPRPRKAATKKKKIKKGSLEALDRAIAIINKHNLDFGYSKRMKAIIDSTVIFHLGSH